MIFLISFLLQITPPAAVEWQDSLSGFRYEKRTRKEKDYNTCLSVRARIRKGLL